MSNITSAEPSHVVGIGASAGGLNALETFFERLPTDTGMAFVVIQHLSPHFKSLMDDLLARHTAMPIHVATHGLVVEANQIYLIPPNTQMALQGRELHLSERNQSPLIDLPIDVFLNSLAQSVKSNAIAIILSGTGTDGSRGIKAVRREGGLVLVQTPESAQFDGMPRSALATGICDYSSDPLQLAELLGELAKDPTDLRAKVLDATAEDVSTRKFKDLFEQLQTAFEIDFSRYKTATVARRIQRRMDFLEIKSVGEYSSFLSANANELQALYHDLLIGVTEFFRDSEYFDYLAQETFPELLREAREEDGLRIWSAGCATGEEAYSLAIVATEAAEAVGFNGRISVFATDVHRSSLEIASAGSYEGKRLTNVSPARLARYFKSEGDDHYRVNTDLRKMVVFAPHNLAKDAPFGKLDLVCCRNLLIYLQPELQDRVISTFHFALRQRGILFLGPSEAPGIHGCAFDTVDQHRKLFRKSCEKALPMMLPMRQPDRPPQLIMPVSAPLTNRATSIDRQLLYDYDAILARMAPGVIIDEKRQVLHYCGDIARFLTEPSGRPRKDLLELLEGDLHVALCTALPRAEKSKEAVSLRGLRMKREEEEVLVDLVIDPIWDSRSRTTHYHVYFPEIRPTMASHDLPAEFTEYDSVSQQEVVIQDLRNELRSTKENLQTAVEELQSSNEQLQSTNEELLASNEELQSTNEELHSVNEELYTVNTEFERKNTEMAQINLDLENLLASIQVGIIFLDKSLRIRKFNEFSKICFKLLPHDVGRPIDHIAYDLESGHKIADDVRMVLTTGKVHEKEVPSADGTILLKRVMPFRSEQGEVEGVVLTFTDVTSLKEAERALGRMNADLEVLVKERTEQLTRSLAEKKTLLQEVHHRVKNNLQVIASLLRIQSEMLKDQIASGALKESHERVLSMALIHEQLYGNHKMDQIDFGSYTQTLVSELVRSYSGPANRLSCRYNLDSVFLQIDQAIPCGLILNELVTNALKYAYPEGKRGEVSIDLKENETGVVSLEVSDQGIGLPPEFDWHNSESMGLPIVELLIEQLGGSLKVRSSPGASFRVEFARDKSKSKASAA